MGYGIEARFERCKRYWEPHLSLTKSFIKGVTLTKTEPSVLIVGSGRLYDFPTETLDGYSGIVLFDADPASLKYCKGRYRHSRIKTIHGDVTGTISDWTAEVESKIKRASSEADVADILRALTPKAAPILSKSDTVVSLNMLGQIPVYWRERLKKIFGKCGVEANDRDEFPIVVEEAFRLTAATLQLNALKAMIDAAGERFIIITDRYYHYYHKDSAHWLTHDALYIDLNDELSNLTLLSSDSWLWHVAPQDIESPDYGVIHEVYAAAFSK